METSKNSDSEARPTFSCVVLMPRIMATHLNSLRGVSEPYGNSLLGFTRGCLNVQSSILETSQHRASKRNSEHHVRRVILLLIRFRLARPRFVPSHVPRLVSAASAKALPHKFCRRFLNINSTLTVYRSDCAGRNLPLWPAMSKIYIGRRRGKAPGRLFG